MAVELWMSNIYFILYVKSHSIKIIFFKMINCSHILKDIFSLFFLVFFHIVICCLVRGASFSGVLSELPSPGNVTQPMEYESFTSVARVHSCGLDSGCNLEFDIDSRIWRCQSYALQECVFVRYLNDWSHEDSWAIYLIRNVQSIFFF